MNFDESDIKELSRDLFGEGEEPLTENQYRAIKTIIDERDDLAAAVNNLRHACEEFVGHYPRGINPFLDDACIAARAAIACLPRELRREAADKQSYDDLAASGGIVDAP